MVGLILFVIGFKYWNPEKNKVSKFIFEHDSFFQNFGAVMTFINGMAIFILSISLLCSYANAKAEKEEKKILVQKKKDIRAEIKELEAQLVALGMKKSEIKKIKEEAKDGLEE